MRAVRRAVARHIAPPALALVAASAFAHAEAWRVQPPLDAAPPGWRCQSAAALPAPWGTVAACRRSDGASSRLALLQIGAGDAAPRELGDLGDAARAKVHVHVPPAPCAPAGGAPCLAALVLVDQRDESSCHGTAVWVGVAGQPLASRGFVDDVRAEGCAGGDAAVRGAAGGARISLPGPLVRFDRQGRAVPVAAARVEYDVTAAPGALKRRVVAR